VKRRLHIDRIQLRLKGMSRNAAHEIATQLRHRLAHQLVDRAYGADTEASPTASRREINLETMRRAPGETTKTTADRIGRTVAGSLESRNGSARGKERS
jgi:hypothetical protein